MYKKCFTVVILLSFLSACIGVGALWKSPSKEQIVAAKKIGAPVVISAIYGIRNSVNGIDISITYQNIDDSRTIKYCTFDISFFNDVGDKVLGKISRRDNVRLQATGPIEPGKINYGSSLGGRTGWKAVFYHPNASKIVVNSISVEFTDGSKVESIDVSGLSGTQYIISPWY